MLQVDVLGVKSDLGGRYRGSWIGPEVVREAGLGVELEALHIPFVFRQDIDAPRHDPAKQGNERVRFARQIAELGDKVRESVLQSHRQGRIPVTFGGDHSIALGTLAATLNFYDPAGCGVLWVDAHGDINTPSTSPSGNLHGMVLGSALGLPSGLEGEADKHWNQILGVFNNRVLPRENLFWVGLRNLDIAEKDRILQLPNRPARTMTDVDREGIARCVEAARDHFRTLGIKHVHVSFDVDVVDPSIAPGTGTTVTGGLTYREAHLAAELLHEFFLWPNDPNPRLVALDIVEVQPITDEQNRTARLAVELTASVLGKRILPLVP